MRHLWLALVFCGCATSPTDEVGPGGIPTPQPQGGKGDSPAEQCGSSTCEADLCAWDCSASNSQCTAACETDQRKDVFVTANVSGGVTAAVDSRQTAYVPKFELVDVMIYGCELWNFQDGNQGFEIELTQLVSSSGVVDPNDPAVFQNKLDVYVDHFNGVGSYNGDATFAASSTADASGGHYYTKNGCTVSVTAQLGGLSGAFSCELAAGSSSATMTGQFSCPGNSLEGPNFIAWQP